MWLDSSKRLPGNINSSIPASSRIMWFPDQRWRGASSMSATATNSSTPTIDALRLQCASVYEYFSEKASAQRELFGKVEPARDISVMRKQRPLPSAAAAEEVHRSNG